MGARGRGCWEPLGPTGRLGWGDNGPLLVRTLKAGPGRAGLARRAWGKAQVRPATPGHASPGPYATGAGRARVGPNLRASGRAAVRRAAWASIATVLF